MSAEENIRTRLSELLDSGTLPRSACGRAFLQALRPALDSGVVAEEKSSAGRRFVVRDAEALRVFFAGRYPDAQAFSDAPSRIASIARFRDSKTMANDAEEIVCVRAWNGRALLRDDIPVDVVTATREHGVFAFTLGDKSPYSLRGSCALVENPVMFAFIERLNLPLDLAIYGHGRASSRLLDWLAQMITSDFTLLHLPDYDPTGLNEFTRLRARLGKHARLHLPDDLPMRFAHFAKRSLLETVNSQILLRNLRQSQVPDITPVVELIEKHNAGLEQEALLLGARSDLRPR